MSDSISIAVLPFRNISNNKENDFFCDGISEEIIHALAKIKQLRVISRTSSFYFKDQQASIGEIREKLDIDIVIDGSVRISEETLRISAQLINVEDESNFWSQSWSRKMQNLFEIQDEISLLIADKLREHLGHLEISEHLIESNTANIVAYQHYLKGRYHFNQWNPTAVNLSIKEYEKAVALDQNLIDGYLGLADSYSFLGVAGFAPRENAWAKAKDAMDKAKAIDPNHAGLNFMLANQAFFTEASFSLSMKYALNALASVPNHADSLRLISFLYLLCGSEKKAKDHIYYAKSIDPLNPETLFYEAFYYYRLKDYAQASIILEGLLKDNDRNLPAIITYIYTKIKENQLEVALIKLESTPQEILTPDERVGLHSLIDLSNGNKSSSHLTELIKIAEDPIAHHAHSYLFLSYSMSGKYEEAFSILENLFQYQSSILLLSFSDPLADDIKTHPRYQQYHDKIYAQSDNTSSVKKSKSRLLDTKTIDQYSNKLKVFMDAEKPFLNPALTLRLLANYIHIHPNQLSWLLNEHFEKNFNEFVNEKRIEHFKKLVVNPANAHISLIGLAYESGFNSKSVFNTTFKKQVGMTPKEYQKSQS